MRCLKELRWLPAMMHRSRWRRRSPARKQQFVEMMNKRAAARAEKHPFRQLQRPARADHYSSAHDIAIMSRELLKHNEITKYTGVYQDYLRKIEREAVLARQYE